MFVKQNTFFQNNYHSKYENHHKDPTIQFCD
jgi:hypothetical protein